MKETELSTYTHIPQCNLSYDVVHNRNLKMFEAIRFWYLCVSKKRPGAFGIFVMQKIMCCIHIDDESTDVRERQNTCNCRILLSIVNPQALSAVDPKENTTLLPKWFTCRDIIVLIRLLLRKIQEKTRSPAKVRKRWEA